MTLRDLIGNIYVSEYEISLFSDGGDNWIGDIYMDDIAWIDKYMDCKVVKWKVCECARLTFVVIIEY